MKKIATLPSLIFGNESATEHGKALTYVDQLSKIIPSLHLFKPIDDAEPFYSRTKIVQINDLKMIASATTPVYMHAAEFKEINLMIPFYGNNTTTLDGKAYRWMQHQYAILMPAVNRYGTCTKRSMLTFDLNPKRIFETAQTMLGADNVRLSDLKLYEPRLIPLSYGSFSFDDTIKQLCLYVDQYISHTKLLNSMKLDEQFYRIIVMMLIPQRFFNDFSLNTLSNAIESKHAIELLIDYVESTGHLFHTLSDLEKFTGLSSRVLQMAFKKHLMTTPTIWLRVQKLKYARKLIIESMGYMSITAIALESGFNNFSLFAKYYKEQFGELPSDTIGKIKLH